MTPRTGGTLAVIAALLASTILAGCIGTAAATAMETRSPADSAALAWDDGAQLAQVVGIEGSLDFAAIAAAMSGAGPQSSGDYDQASEDEAVGDGRAEVWGYRYVASGKDAAYVVIVDRDGEILREGEEVRISALSTPIGEWGIDSDRALAIAKEANTGISAGVEGESFAIVSVLRHEPGAENPVWLVAGGGGSLAGAGGGFVELDAVTGEVLKSEGHYVTPEDFASAWG